MTRVIVAATSIYGHVAPMLPVARDLVTQGHDVAFVTGSMFRDVVEATGATFVPVAGAADVDVSVEVARPGRLALPPGVEQFAYDMRALFADAIPEQFRVLNRLIAESDEPVVLVHEVWFWGGVPYFLDTVALHADRLLQLSLEELSYMRPDLPDSVEFVGALPAPPSDIALPAWWNEVRAADQVVVVTQGTVANHDLSELVEPALRALADLPVLVIAATGRDATIRKLPGNARVAPYIPFARLLPETDVLITNGGFGGVQQSLSHGVPLLLAGITEEKLESNVRVAATGAAIDLATQRPTPDAIRAAVVDILGTAGYRAAAGRLQAQYATLDPLASVASAVDELAGTVRAAV